MKTVKKVLLILSVLVLLSVVFCISVRLLYPIKYTEEIKLYAKEYELDPYFVLSVIKSESNFDPEAVSAKNAVGLMQITGSTANWIADRLELDAVDTEELKDPDLNIKMGCYYLSYLEDMYDKNFDCVLAAYNAGFGNVDKWLCDEKYSDDGVNLGSIPYPETERYVDKIKNNYEVYKLIKNLPSPFAKDRF